jgi:hypothetical protein
MTAAAQPLVAFVCRAPVLSEALATSLALVANVRSFPAGRPDPEGLVRALRPDALVVDDLDEANTLVPYARASRVPLVLIAVESNELRLLGNDGWDVVSYGDGIEGIRNLLVAQLFGGSLKKQNELVITGERAPEIA